MLTDDSRNQRQIPTREYCMLISFSQWHQIEYLVYSSMPSNGWSKLPLPMTLSSFTVCFHQSTQAFTSHNHIDSGHGGQTKDLDGDEADGYDEGT